MIHLSQLNPMPPPPFKRAESKRLIVRLRVLCKEKGINHHQLKKIINSELHPSDGVTTSTTNKWLYESRIGNWLNSESTIAIQKVVKSLESTPAKP